MSTPTRPPSGNCSATLATLELHSENLLLLALQFVMNESSSRVFLQGVQLNLTLPDAKEGSFTATNSSLRALQATAGNSYKCNAEQRLRVTSSFSSTCSECGCRRSAWTGTSSGLWRSASWTRTAC